MFLREFAGLLCVLGLAAVSASSIRQAGSCPYKNLIIANGATYATTVNGRCLKYTCKSGTLTESEFACHFDSRCFLEGQTYTQACHEFRCNRIESSPSVVYSMVMVSSAICHVCLSNSHQIMTCRVGFNYRRFCNRQLLIAFDKCMRVVYYLQVC